MYVCMCVRVKYTTKIVVNRLNGNSGVLDSITRLV